jgi:hypothetical protein
MPASAKFGGDAVHWNATIAPETKLNLSLISLNGKNGYLYPFDFLSQIAESVQIFWGGIVPGQGFRIKANIGYPASRGQVDII